MRPHQGLRRALRGTRAFARHRGPRSLGWMAIALVTIVVALPAASATSAALVTGKQIKDASVTGTDVRDGSLAAHEFAHLVQGPGGPQGPEGPAGGPGPSGSVGTSGWTTVVSQVGIPVPAGQSASTEVDCPSGVAVGGGASASDPTSAEVSESAPVDLTGTGWFATVTNAGAQPITIFAWAICVTK
jgi:hypothetical protein